MAIIAHELCASCGGCVSVCPEGARWLAEMRLEINENCVGCGEGYLPAADRIRLTAWSMGRLSK